MTNPLPLVLATILLAVVLCGCRNVSSGPTEESKPERSEISDLQTPISNSNAGTTERAGSETVNINAASREELQRLPYVGPSMAEKVLEYREKHGPFRKPEDLMRVDGISDMRFRRIRHLIRVE